MKKTIRLTESELTNLIKESVNRIIQEEVDMGQILSAQDKEDRARSRMNFDNRPEIRAAYRELRNLRYCIEDVENEGGDITPIRKKIRNINNHYFDGDYLWHLGRGDKWIDYKGWFDENGNLVSDSDWNLTKY